MSHRLLFATMALPMALSSMNGEVEFPLACALAVDFLVKDPWQMHLIVAGIDSQLHNESTKVERYT